MFLCEVLEVGRRRGLLDSERGIACRPRQPRGDGESLDIDLPCPVGLETTGGFQLSFDSLEGSDLCAGRRRVIRTRGP